MGKNEFFAEKVSSSKFMSCSNEKNYKLLQNKTPYKRTSKKKTKEK